MTVEPFRNQPIETFQTEEAKREMREALRRVRAEFGRHYGLYIDGAWVDTQEKIQSLNPSAPSEVVGSTAKAGLSEAEAALEAAWRAFKTWKDWPQEDRSRLLLKAAALMKRRRRELEATLRIYKALREEGFSGVGVVLQSYLFRTEKDFWELLPYRPNLRLVKGAYREPKEVAFQDKRLIDAEFLHLGKLALKEGLYVAFATHDPRLIAEVKRYTGAMGVPKDRFEFQFLYGVRPEEQRRLAQEGYTVRAYVPYGTHWYPYLSRRIAERPENLFLVLRSLLGG